MDAAIFPEFFASWLDKETVQRILDVSVLLLVGLVVQEVLLIVSSRFRKKLEDEGSGTENVRATRAKTLTNVLFTSISVAGWVILIILVLDKLGVNITPILASAGVIGLAISFGSQELVKDVISGFFFLLENQFNVGDIIEVKGKKGRVVDMSFRAVTIKDPENEAVHIYRNSLVDVVTRFNKNSKIEPANKDAKDAKS